MSEVAPIALNTPQKGSTRTSIKTFVTGALVGTFLGATFLGAISHLLVIGLATLGVGTVVLHGARGRVSVGIARRSLRR